MALVKTPGDSNHTPRRSDRLPAEAARGAAGECRPAARFQRQAVVLSAPPEAPLLFLSQPRIVRKSRVKRANFSRGKFCSSALAATRRAGVSVRKAASGQPGRSATFLRAWLLNEWELRGAGPSGAQPPRSAAATPTFLLLRRRGCRCDRQGLFSALLLHEVLLKKREGKRGTSLLGSEGILKAQPLP